MEEEIEEKSSLYGEELLKHFPWPKCCDKLIQSRIIVAHFPSGDYCYEEKPEWTLEMPQFISKHHIDPMREKMYRDCKKNDLDETISRAWELVDSFSKITFCPYCSTKLPELKLKKNPPVTHECSDGGYYCDTCRERIMVCCCLPQQAKWELA